MKQGGYGGRVKYILKDTIKFVPLYGWYLGHVRQDNLPYLTLVGQYVGVLLFLFQGSGVILVRGLGRYDDVN